jgi:hypothetical protein
VIRRGRPSSSCRPAVAVQDGGRRRSRSRGGARPVGPDLQALRAQGRQPKTGRWRPCPRQRGLVVGRGLGDDSAGVGSRCGVAADVVGRVGLTAVVVCSLGWSGPRPATDAAWGSGEPSMTEGYDPLAGRDAFAHSLGELRPGLPDPGDVFATLQRVIDATRAVVQVDGASLALEHEDGSLRWVVTDGAAGLLEGAQLPGGRGPSRARRSTPRRRWRPPRLRPPRRTVRRTGRPPAPTTGRAEPRRRLLWHAIQENTASRACSTLARRASSLSSRGASGSVERDEGPTSTASAWARFEKRGNRGNRGCLHLSGPALPGVGVTGDPCTVPSEFTFVPPGRDHAYG